MLIIDAHLDLAMSALEWNRDLARPITEIRARELVMLGGGREGGIPTASTSDAGGTLKPVPAGAGGEDPPVLEDDDLPF